VEGIGGLGSSKKSVLFIMKAFLLLTNIRLVYRDNKVYIRLLCVKLYKYFVIF